MFCRKALLPFEFLGRGGCLAEGWGGGRARGLDPHTSAAPVRSVASRMRMVNIGFVGFVEPNVHHDLRGRGFLVSERVEDRQNQGLGPKTRFCLSPRGGPFVQRILERSLVGWSAHPSSVYTPLHGKYCLEELTFRGERDCLSTSHPGANWYLKRRPPTVKHSGRANTIHAPSWRHLVCEEKATTSET